jgi:hypothetical protein
MGQRPVFSFRLRLRRTDSQENFIPFVMCAGRRFSVPGELLFQHFAVAHFGNVHQAPTWKLAAAVPSHLIAEQAHDSILNPVIVRLRDPLLVLVSKSNQASSLNGGAEQLIE